ncbi:MAG: (d)CMP kinase [Alphaproteobacteria bacterium]|jgi:cytidylate kinase|nr:(d)CMP kinase [Alphaproteobacteria bacterium]
MIIAVDGPAGAGKGTISEYLAMKFDLMYLDTGLLFRALAKAVLKEGINPTHREAVARIARTIQVSDIDDPDLRGEDIAAVASQVAVIEEVRQVLTDLQRQFCRSVKAPYKGAILDGRDIGTVICPDATCKLFVTARPEIRNKRRLLETQMSSDATKEVESVISQKIAERDSRDSTRKIAPLTPAPDAIIIDTSDLTIDEACTKAALYVAECCMKIEER